MKVKILDDILSLRLENKVNDFIKDKEIIDIKFTRNMASGEYTFSTVYCVLIMYKDK